MNISYHLRKDTYGRLGMPAREFMKLYKDEMIELDRPSRDYPGLRGNFNTHPHQTFLVYPNQNIGLSYDPITDTLCTALYLDGRDGYTRETTQEWRERMKNKRDE